MRHGQSFETQIVIMQEAKQDLKKKLNIYVYYIQRR